MKKLLEHFIEFVESNDYDICWDWIDKNSYGAIDEKKLVIRINLDLFITTTTLHEWLHEQFPQKTEQQILKMEDYIINKLTVKQIKKLAQIICANMPT